MNPTHDTTIQVLEFIEMGLTLSPGKTVFSDFSLQLPTEKIVRIHGAPGSGKSSLLRMMAGLMEPTSGDFQINKESIREMTFRDFMPYRLKIGYSFEMGGLLSNRTVFENLALPLQFHQIFPPDIIREKVQELIALFGLEDVSRQRPSELSVNNRKSAVVARAVIHQPDVLLLDDPTTGLSEENKSRLKTFITEKRSKGILKHVFLCSDDLRFCENFVEKTIHIEKLKIRAAA